MIGGLSSPFLHMVFPAANTKQEGLSPLCGLFSAALLSSVRPRRQYGWRYKGRLMTLIFKIVPKTLWQEALEGKVFKGAPIDLADGFIHFSDLDQVKETASKHFAGKNDLLLAAFESDGFGDALKWEPSRGGALFPHLYATLDPATALWVKDLPLAEDGSHVFPELRQ